MKHVKLSGSLDPLRKELRQQAYNQIVTTQANHTVFHCASSSSDLLGFAVLLLQSACPLKEDGPIKDAAHSLASQNLLQQCQGMFGSVVFATSYVSLAATFATSHVSLATIVALCKLAHAAQT